MGNYHQNASINPNDAEQNKWVTARKLLNYLICCDLVAQVESSLGDSAETDTATMANITLSAVITAATTKTA